VVEEGNGDGNGDGGEDTGGKKKLKLCLTSF